MILLKDQGTFEIISCTSNVIESITNAARTCYQSFDKSSPENDLKLVKNLIEKGHSAMLEFADMTVRFKNVSRGFTHQIVRHRLVSFAMESTRYVDTSEFEVICPPHKDMKENFISDNHPGIEWNVENWFIANENMYALLKQCGWKSEDARQILPTAIKSDIVVKANMREWRYIFSERCRKAAHWEIRSVMLKLLKYCKENIPILFDDFRLFEESARKVMSKNNLKNEIKYYILSGGKLDDLIDERS